MTRSPLMLVSANADASLRNAVANGERPRPEYLILESEYGVELLDWSRLPGSRHGRTMWTSTFHVAAALKAIGGRRVVFSDSEHVGIPLALAMRTFGISIPHVVIGHHLTTPSKANLFRRLHADHGMTRILVHSVLQAELAHRDLGVPRDRLVYQPYYADTEFWQPTGAEEERLIVAAGREHRDYKALAEACGQIDVNVFIAAGSVHSPAARSLMPEVWPNNFRTAFAGYRKLREAYARSALVVVPLIDTDFQAGVTTVLEAMSMAKPVVVTSTKGQSQLVQDGVTGISVRPHDSLELHDAIRFLLGNASERRRLGEAARAAVLEQYSAEAYAASLSSHLADVARVGVIAA